MIGYPLSFQELSTWSAQHKVPIAETRVRFAQYGVLTAIAQSRLLHGLLVFKGGNALDFIWQPNRSTTDLDFSVDIQRQSSIVNAVILQQTLDRTLNAAGRALNITFTLHSVRQQPPGPDKTFITYEARVGYALQDQARLIQRMHLGEPGTQVLSIDISMNEIVCAAVDVPIDGTRSLRVCTIEDIIAEKLRALLQQQPRNRTRPQDLLDIAVCLRKHDRTDLDRNQIGRFLLEKSNARGIVVSRAAFADRDLRRRAQQDYDALERTTRVQFVPFEEAMTMLLDLVATLDIP